MKTSSRYLYVFLVLIIAATMLVGCGGANDPIRPVIPPGHGYRETTRSVTWNGRAGSHMSNALLRNGSANFAHIQIDHGRNPNVLVTIPNLPNITEIRFIGDWRMAGPRSTSNAGVVISNNQHMIHFADLANVNSGVLMFRLRARNNAIGYFSVTFERNPAPPAFPERPGASFVNPPSVYFPNLQFVPSPPTLGRPNNNFTTISNRAIPEEYRATYTIRGAGITHRVDLTAGGINLHQAFAGVNVTDLDMRGFTTVPTITAQYSNFLARTRITDMRTSSNGLWFAVTATGFISNDSRPHSMTFQVNVNNYYLVISNFTSTFPQANDAAASVVYRRR